MPRQKRTTKRDFAKLDTLLKIKLFTATLVKPMLISDAIKDFDIREAIEDQFTKSQVENEGYESIIRDRLRTFIRSGKRIAAAVRLRVLDPNYTGDHRTYGFVPYDLIRDNKLARAAMLVDVQHRVLGDASRNPAIRPALEQLIFNFQEQVVEPEIKKLMRATGTNGPAPVTPAPAPPKLLGPGKKP